MIVLLVSDRFPSRWVVILHSRHLLDFPSLQRCIESYLCHRYKPFERQQDDSINHKQSHHMLLLVKLDKLVVAIYKRLVEVYNKECTNFHRFAASAKLSVFKSNDKGHQDNQYTLQAELRSLFQEKLRILRLPYLLELVALMGESNSTLASSLLSALTQIRPAITSEIVPAIRESQQVRWSRQSFMAFCFTCIHQITS